jgi:hypothetical protein
MCCAGTAGRTYNAPTGHEVAAWTPDGEEPESTRREIRFVFRDGTVKKINELNRWADPLRYPILMPYGEHGWHIKIPLKGISEEELADTPQDESDTPHDDLDDDAEGEEDINNNAQQKRGKRQTVSVSVVQPELLNTGDLVSVFIRVYFIRYPLFPGLGFLLDCV